MSKFDFLDKFNKPKPFDVDSSTVESFANEIGGELVLGDSGKFLLLSTDYPPGFSHGSKSLKVILEERQVRLANFEPRHSEIEYDLADCVFVDAETTGLSAASGTVAFLIGVGVVEKERLLVHQFFLPDYPDEAAMLDSIAELVASKKVVVSFNGKCFDLPLLETRYTMNRMKTPFESMHHIDLLHCCRRFWRGRFADSTLQTLERELLGVYRYNDTPGFMIPQLYFDYLSTGRSEPLQGVLLHNRLDIVTLLFLVDAIQNYLGSAEKFEYYSTVDALRISKFLFRQGKLEKACVAALSQLYGSSIESERLELGLHLFRLQKKLGQFNEALNTLALLTDFRGETRLLIWNESAKILEHKKREFESASKVILQALEYLDNPIADIPFDRTLFWNETLTKRRQRLLKRLQ